LAGALAPARAAAQAPPDPTPPAAQPAPQTDEAKSRLDELRRLGDDAITARRYADAIAYYEQALQLSPEPKLLYNIARAYEGVGRYPNALASLLRFKTEAPSELLQQVPNLDKRIAALRARVTAVTVNVNAPAARVLVRNQVVGTTPREGPLVVSIESGRAAVEILVDGYLPYHKDVELPGGGSVVLDVQLVPRGEAKQVTTQAREAREAPGGNILSQWWFWAGAGAVVFGGALLVYGLSTEKNPGRGDIGSGQVAAPLVRFLPSRRSNGRAAPRRGPRTGERSGGLRKPRPRSPLQGTTVTFGTTATFTSKGGTFA
jgi:hypothetical protein